MHTIDKIIDSQSRTAALPIITYSSDTLNINFQTKKNKKKNKKKNNKK